MDVMRVSQLGLDSLLPCLRVCINPYGQQLGLATLPFDTHTGVHDGCAEAMLQIWRKANVHFIHEPREFVRDRARGRRVVQEVPAHGRHAGDFFGHQGRMFHR